jgi:hypothetical protein
MSDGNGVRAADRARGYYGRPYCRPAWRRFCSSHMASWRRCRRPGRGVGCRSGSRPGGSLAILLLWPSRRSATKSRTFDEVTRMLGVASAVLGIGAAMLVAYGLVLNFTEERFSAQTQFYRLTHPSVLYSLLIIAAPATITGVLHWSSPVAGHGRPCASPRRSSTDG